MVYMLVYTVCAAGLDVGYFLSRFRAWLSTLETPTLPFFPPLYTEFPRSFEVHWDQEFLTPPLYEISARGSMCLPRSFGQ
ncbi:hypothetical protein FQZ97_666250 [compost metagenome]